MASVASFLTESLEELGILGAGETATANDLDYAFRRLNRLFDRMKIEGSLVPYPQTRTTQALGTAPADGLYTVGTGGDFNRPRPQWINSVKFYDTTVTEVTELDLGSLTDAEFANISQKVLTNTYPTSYYWNPTYGSTGRASLTFWPVPTSTTLVGVLYAPSAIAEFAAVTDTISVPPGYHEFLVYEVALRLAPGFRRVPSQELKDLHASARTAVQAINLRQSDLMFPGGSLPSVGRHNGFDNGFYSGWNGS